MSNTLSKLLKGQEADQARHFSFQGAEEESGAGVRRFELKQMGPAYAKDSAGFNSGAGAEPGVPGVGSNSAAADSQPSAGEPSSAEPPEPEIDVEAIQKTAFQEGYAEGERAGSEAALEQFRGAIASFGRTVQELTALKPNLRAEAEKELVELSLTIARRVVRRELSVDPTTVLALVRTCFDVYQRAEIHSVRVSPEDYEAVSAYFEENPAQNLEVRADSDVDVGGAVFETSQGQLDARVETQLGEIEYGLADR